MEADLQALDPDFETVLLGPQPPKNFTILDLPLELVVTIIELVVQIPRSIDPTKARKRKDQIRIVHPPPICSTSKLLRHEGLNAFYRLNNFELCHWGGVPCVRDWLIAMGDENRKAMGTLTFHAKFVFLMSRNKPIHSLLLPLTKRCSPRRFSEEFWEEKFAQIGIATKVKAAEDQDRARSLGPTFMTLGIMFV